MGRKESNQTNKQNSEQFKAATLLRLENQRMVFQIGQYIILF